MTITLFSITGLWYSQLLVTDVKFHILIICPCRQSCGVRVTNSDEMVRQRFPLWNSLHPYRVQSLYREWWGGVTSKASSAQCRTTSSDAQTWPHFHPELFLEPQTCQYMSALQLLTDFHFFYIGFLDLIHVSWNEVAPYPFAMFLNIVQQLRNLFSLSEHVGTLSTGNIQKTSRGQCCLTSLNGNSTSVLTQAGRFAIE